MRPGLLNASTPLDRRTFLQAGGLSAVGLSLPQLFAARAGAEVAPDKALSGTPSSGKGGTAKACILLYMLGGPPQQETFDLKPEAPGTARSLFRPIATNVPGIEICELNTDFNRAPPQGAAGLPGTLPPGFTLRDDIGPNRLGKRLELQQTLGRPQVGEGTSLVRDWTKHQAQALDVLGAGSTWRAFAIDDEPPALRARYGDDRLGRSCLVARRLVDAGVTLVTVIFGGWDTHSHHLEHTRDLLLPPLNRAFGALLDDLADRGLLDTTLVAWTGEFGRTPTINGNSPPGRDHWGRVYSTVLAGGGVQGGQVYGKSDSLAADPKDNPVPVADFVATIYHALGYDLETEVVDAFGRPTRIVAGRPVLGLF